MLSSHFEAKQADESWTPRIITLGTQGTRFCCLTLMGACAAGSDGWPHLSGLQSPLLLSLGLVLRTSSSPFLLSF